MKYLILIFLFIPFLFFGQDVISGKVLNTEEKEWVHIFNKTYNQYTITNKEGEFEIAVRINDTLVFSAIQFQLKEVVVTKEIINSMMMSVLLENQVNELQAVYLSPSLLSGDLLFDSREIKTKAQVTASTLNLPNSNVKRLSLAERKLFTASSSKGVVSLDPIINAISGKTKKLKQSLQYEKQISEDDMVFNEFKEAMLKDFKIPENNLYHFLYFASEDKIYSQILNTNSNIVIYDFIKAKSKTYLAQQNNQQNK
jgi:hypothetical protein